MSSFTHGVSGASTPRDLETALQLLHLYFTAPNRTPEAFELMKRRLRAVLANQAQSPGAVFGERVRQVNTNNHYTARSLTPEDVEKLSADTMWSYYDARFSNAADFTFFFVGAFDVPTITPLITTYIGSLPSKGTSAARMGDVRLAFPTEVRREAVRKGKEPKSQTVMSFFADTGLDELEMHRARAAATVLELRLRDRLREDLGGTYSVGVEYSNTQPQPGYGTMTVEFGSAPENVDKLSQVVIEELATLRADGPTEQEIKNIQEMERRDLETSMRQNAYWLNSLQTVHLLGWNPLRIAARMERAASLTRENVHAAFTKYFPDDRYTVVTLLPEATAQD
jgi:zinc protease